MVDFSNKNLIFSQFGNFFPWNDPEQVSILRRFFFESAQFLPQTKTIMITALIHLSQSEAVTFI